MFRVFFSSHGESAFGALSKEVQERVIAKLAELSADPAWYRHAKKLRGSKNKYRLRVGRWRVLFKLKGNEIEVSDIFLKKGSGDYRRRK